LLSSQEAAAAAQRPTILKCFSGPNSKFCYPSQEAADVARLREQKNRSPEKCFSGPNSKFCYPSQEAADVALAARSEIAPEKSKVIYVHCRRRLHLRLSRHLHLSRLPRLRQPA
jgi:hypothetical protein